MVFTTSHTMQAEASTIEEVEAIFAAMRESFGKFGISRVAMWLTVDTKTVPPIVPKVQQTVAAVAPTPEPVIPSLPAPAQVIPDKYAASLTDYGYADVTNISKEKRHDALVYAVVSKGRPAILSKLRFLADLAANTPVELARKRLYEEDFYAVSLGAQL